MFYSKVVLLLLAALNVDAFAPLSSNQGSFVASRPTPNAVRFQPVSVSLSEIGDSLTAEDADDDDDDDYTRMDVGDLDDVEVIEDASAPSPAMLSQEKIAELRLQHRRHETDTGSPEYQVAGMTERIRYLTGHLQEHPKDFSTRRGLVALVNKRRRLLNYLFRESADRYYAIVKSLGIRHKAPSPIQDRAEQYGRFPKQKAVKKHLK